MGASEQGIVDPVRAAEVRGASDMYRGIGVDANDPFENFRKSRAGVFIQKLKDRDEKLQKMKKGEVRTVSVTIKRCNCICLRCKY